jgi:hypothetical protein
VRRNGEDNTNTSLKAEVRDIGGKEERRKPPRDPNSDRRECWELNPTKDPELEVLVLLMGR